MLPFNYRATARIARAALARLATLVDIARFSGVF
jgi:hypothetical protein